MVKRANKLDQFLSNLTKIYANNLKKFMKYYNKRRKYIKIISNYQYTHDWFKNLLKSKKTLTRDNVFYKMVF